MKHIERVMERLDRIVELLEDNLAKDTQDGEGDVAVAKNTNMTDSIAIYQETSRALKDAAEKLIAETVSRSSTRFPGKDRLRFVKLSAHVWEAFYTDEDASDTKVARYELILSNSVAWSWSWTMTIYGSWPMGLNRRLCGALGDLSEGSRPIGY